MAGKSTTLLGYETTYEIKTFDLATNFQTVGNYRMACFWASQFAYFVGCDNIPTKPPIPRDPNQALPIWEDYFELLVGNGLKEAREKVNRIRALYMNKNGIPTVDKNKLPKQMVTA